MEFLKYTENKDIVSECTLEIVDEGWGSVFAKLISGVGGAVIGAQVGGFLGSIFAGVPGALGGALSGAVVGASDAVDQVNDNIDNKFSRVLLKNPKLIDVIKKQCDEVLARKKKELKDKSLSTDIQISKENIKDVKMDSRISFLDSIKYRKRTSDQIKAFEVNLKGYCLFITHDTDSIKHLILIAQSKKTGTIYGWNIPAPSLKS